LPEVAEQLARAIAPIPELVERSHHALARTVTRGTFHAIDTRHPLGRYVHEQAFAYLGGAADHLQTWHDLVHHVLPAYAHMTLLRGVVENTAWARWLLDPALATDERVARAVASQIKDYGDRHQFEHATGLDAKPRPSGKHGAERRADLIAARNSQGVAPLRLPAATEVCERYVVSAGPLVGGAVYRLLSAFAHGRQWTLLVSSLQDVGFVRVPTGAHPMRVSANEEAAIMLTMLAVRQFSMAVVDAERYQRGRPAP
jgi:hypothetical protein